jgi:hypothetical protein
MQPIPLFSPAAFRPHHLAAEYERQVNQIAGAIRRLGHLEALVGHLARALIAHQARLQTPGEEWPEGVTFVQRRLAPIVVPSMLPGRDMLSSMAHGLGAPLVQRAQELHAAQPGGKLLDWLVYAAEREGRRTPLRGRVLVPDVIPIFDNVWLNVLKQRDRRVAELADMDVARLDATGMRTREQVQRGVARWDAHLIGLETLLPPGINEATYETYLRLKSDLPEPLFGSYGPAAGVLL